MIVLRFPQPAHFKQGLVPIGRRQLLAQLLKLVDRPRPVTTIGVQIAESQRG